MSVLSTLSNITLALVLITTDSPPYNCCASPPVALVLSDVWLLNVIFQTAPLPPFRGRPLVSALLSIVLIVMLSVNSVVSVLEYTSVILILSLVLKNAAGLSVCDINNVVPPTTTPSTLLVLCGLTTLPIAPVVSCVTVSP